MHVCASAQSSEKKSSRILNQRNYPIEVATVSIKGIKSVPANADGDYSFEVPTGTFIITVTAVGYKTKENTAVIVKVGSDNAVDIVMDDK